MKIGQSAGTSPYMVFKAAEAIEAEPFSAVTLTETGVKICGNSEIPIGLLSGEFGGAAAGESVNVQLTGGGLWLVGESVTAGDKLSCGENGMAIKASVGSFVFAQALESASGGAVLVLITRSGKEAE